MHGMAVVNVVAFVILVLTLVHWNAMVERILHQDYHRGRREPSTIAMSNWVA